MILRLAEMSVVYEGSGAKAKISIMKSYPLTNSSVRARTQSVSRRASVSQSVSRPKPPRFLPSIPRTPSAVSRPSTPSTPRPQVDVAKFKSWAEAAINTQQEEIDRISGSVVRIEKNMLLFKDFMEEIRAELAFARRDEDQKTGEISVVRGELANLRQQISSNPRPVSRGSFELSKRSLDVIAKDVQLVSHKVDEVDILKEELEQLKAQLRTLQSAAKGTNILKETAFTSTKETEITHPDETATATDHIKDRLSLRGTRSRRKRNHDEVHEHGINSQVEQPERPVKKRRTRNMPTTANKDFSAEDSFVARDQQKNSRSRMVVEIPSSKKVSLGVMPGHDEVGEFNYVEEEVDDDYQPPGPVTIIAALTHHRAPGESGEREITSLSNGTILPLSERLLHSNKVLEPDHRMLAKNISPSRSRAANGLLLSKDGKVDRRSLRFLRDQENRVLSPSSFLPTAPMIEAQVAAAQQNSDSFASHVLPSIEQADSALDPPSLPQLWPGSLSGSVILRDQKPFKCDSCKNRYTSRGGLRYVGAFLSLVRKQN